MEGDDELEVWVEKNLINRATQSIIYEKCLDIQMTANGRHFEVARTVFVMSNDPHMDVVSIRGDFSAANDQHLMS